MAESAGQLEQTQLQEAGFSQDEIQQWRGETESQLLGAGFNDEEVNEYFGEKEPDMKPMGEMFRYNLGAAMARWKPAEGAAPVVKEGEEPLAQPVEAEMEEAKTFVDFLEAGFDMSVTGLMMDKPDMVLPENAPMYARIASQVATLAGDLPAMMVGSVAGAFAGGTAGAVTAGAVGSVVPVAGTVAGLAVGAAAGSVVGGGAGAFALPEAIRSTLMQHYEKGDVKSFGDFWERTSAVFIDSLKAGATGAATVGVGGVVGKVVKGTLAPTAVKTTAQISAEVATMTTVGAALEGHIPQPREFIDGAILVGGLRFAGSGGKKLSAKMRNIYAKTGVRPSEVAAKAAKDPKVKQELLSENNAIPEGFKPVGGEFGKIEIPKNFETVKLKAGAGEVSPAAQTILSKVGEKITPEKPAPSFGKFYTEYIDKLDPINRVTKALTENKAELPADKNPYILSRMAVDHKAKAKHFFERGTIDYHTLETTGHSLKSVLEGVENPDTLNAYMISKRVLEKSKQGLETGFDLKAAEAVVKENRAGYEKAARGVTEFSNNVMEYAVQSGVLSKEAAGRMKEANKDYVPFKRIIEASEEAGAKKPGKASSLKKFKGSTADIQNPMVSIVENTTELLRMAEVNRAKRSLVALAATTPEQTLIKAVPDRLTPIKVTASEMVRALETQGAVETLNSIKRKLKAKGLPVTDEIVAKAFKKENVFKAEAVEDMLIFRKSRQELTPNQFEVFVDGKRKVFETAPEVAEAIGRLGGDTGSTNTFFRIARGITTFKKFGITFTPDFILRNLIRDKVTGSVFSKSGGINPGDVVGAMGDIIKKNETYYRWLKSGGANGAFLELNDAYIAKDIYRLQNKTNFMGSARNVLKKPVDVMRVAAELSEQSIRLAEFKKITKGSADRTKLTEGGFAAREVTIDFQRVGAKLSALNSITAFLNVSVQSLDRTSRAMVADPKAVLTKSAAYITAPSVLLWWANHEDQRYQEIPRWEKDLFWIIPTDDWQTAGPGEAAGLPDYMVRQDGGNLQINKGTIYRIPKPQELGVIFGSLPERVLDAYFTENPNAFRDFSETMTSLVTPNLVPDAVSPALEQYFNKSFFTGNDIIPHHLEGILPEYQATGYTSETAKVLGKMVGRIDKDTAAASPMVIDNYIRSWSGALGQYALQVADAALKKSGAVPDNVDPTDTLADVPFIKAFVVRFPRSNANSVADFYKSYETNKKVVATVKHLAKQGDFENMQKEIKLGMDAGTMAELEGIPKTLSNLSAFVRSVNKNPDMTPDDKRQLIDMTYFNMIEVAKRGNTMLSEIKKSMDEQQ